MNNTLKMAFCRVTGSALLVCGCLTASVAKPVSIDECVQTALVQNRSVLQSEQNAKSAAGKVKEMAGAGLPKLSIFGVASQRSDEITVPLAVDIDANMKLVSVDAPLVPSYVASAGVALTQVLDVSGLTRTGVNVARLGEKVAMLDIGRTRNDVVLLTKLAYYDVLRSDELVTVAQEVMKNAQIRKKTAEALVETGISSKVDVIRADAAIFAAQQSIISSQNALQVSKSVLNRVLGQDVNAPIDLVKPDDVSVSYPSYEDCLTEALANRPEVVMASTAIDVSKGRHKLAKRGMAPGVLLSAAAQSDVAHGSPSDENASIGVKISIPLSDGGETRGRAEQAASEIQSAIIADAEMKAQVSLQVKSAYVHIQNAAEKLSTANKQLEQAAESLRLSRERYEEGMASQVELSDAELLYAQAQTSVVNARYEQFGTQAELDRALGKNARAH
ncbi:MAG: TolC family protein [Armatimonadota bacterium]